MNQTIFTTSCKIIKVLLSTAIALSIGRDLYEYAKMKTRIIRRAISIRNKAASDQKGAEESTEDFQTTDYAI